MCSASLELASYFSPQNRFLPKTTLVAPFLAIWSLTAEWERIHIDQVVKFKLSSFYGCFHPCPLLIV